jgi:hypothetical protein
VLLSSEMRDSATCDARLCARSATQGFSVVLVEDLAATTMMQSATQRGRALASP